MLAVRLESAVANLELRTQRGASVPFALRTRAHVGTDARLFDGGDERAVGDAPIDEAKRRVKHAVHSHCKASNPRQRF